MTKQHGTSHHSHFGNPSPNHTRSTQGNNPAPHLPMPFRNCVDAQCVCGVWGHAQTDCKFMAMLNNRLKALAKDQKFYDDLSSKFMTVNNRNTQMASINILRLTYPDRFSDKSDEEMFHDITANGIADFQSAGY